jgi:hypothetical protein
MLYEPDEEFSLSSWFGTVAEDVRQQYFRYWEQVESAHTPEVAPEDRLAWTHLINLSRGLRRGIDSLAFDAATVDEAKRMLTFLGQDGASDWVAAAWTASLRDNPVVKHGILIELASEAADTLLAGAEQRVLFLTELVAQRVMSERARAFLERATRLYLWGFEPECVVMCACSLEAAYPERFSDLDMFGLQIKKHEKALEYTPAQYEMAAKASRVYSADQGTAAARIRRARNDIVHNVPDLSMPATQALEDTAALLDALFPRSS